MHRIITYNIHSGVGRDGQRDYQRIGRFLASQQADFVLLQEMDTRSPFRDAEADIYDICANGHFTLIPAPTIRTKYGWYGNAILTRHPIKEHSQDDISVPNREPRTLQRAIALVNDMPIMLFNAHLGLRKSERKYQIVRIYELMKEVRERKRMPVCFGGDLNEWWFKTKLFKRLDRRFQHQSPGRSFPSSMPLFKLDRLWTSSDIFVEDAWRINDKAFKHFSDHLPVGVDFNFVC